MSEKIICSKEFHLGKIDLDGTGYKSYPVTIEMKLRHCGGEPTFTIAHDGTKIGTGMKTPEYDELAICGSIGTRIFGQCLDEIAKYADQLSIGAREKFRLLYVLWKHWHLNGLHAGTPEQEAAIKAWQACGNKYDYDAACDFLKQIDLYEVSFTGKTVGREYQAESYTYGHGWVIADLPEPVVELVKNLCRKEQ